MIVFHPPNHRGTVQTRLVSYLATVYVRHRRSLSGLCASKRSQQPFSQAAKTKLEGSSNGGLILDGHAYVIIITLSYNMILYYISDNIKKDNILSPDRASQARQPGQARQPRQPSRLPASKSARHTRAIGAAGRARLPDVVRPQLAGHQMGTVFDTASHEVRYSAK